MAPLENGGFQPSVWTGDRSRPIDSLMRALLYVAQQVGRPISEADVRRLTAVPAAGLDEPAFLTAGARLGLETHAVDLTPDRLNELPVPFVLLAAGRPAHVVVAGRGGQWVVLDVIEAHAWYLSAEEVVALGTRALIMREKLADERRRRWYAPLWTRVRPVILRLAAASFLINLLGLATPLFMMLVLNTVVGPDPPRNVAWFLTLLCAGMLVVYGLDFALRVARSTR
jgi:ABC-type bacteriocin/lantibiotic exporter with double-glycine peptidase domain